MNKNEFLKIVSKQIHFFLDREKIEKELSDHIEDSTLDLMEEGYSKEEAEQIAVNQMGNPTEIGKYLNCEHHPIIGYLWFISTIVSVVMLISLIPTGISAVSGLWEMLTPTVVRNYEEKIPINITVEMPTDKVELDYFCVMENGDIYITYRTWTNMEYSRSGWSSNPFSIMDGDEFPIASGGYSSGNYFGGIGASAFTLMNSKLVILTFRDGQVLELNLEDYGL